MPPDLKSGGVSFQEATAAAVRHDAPQTFAILVIIAAMTQYKLEGRVCGVYLGRDPDSLITSACEQVQADFSGFQGDRHAGLTRRSDSRTPQYPRGTEIRNDRQVSIVSVEDLAAAARKMQMHALEAEWLGANLLIEGIPNLSRLPPNTRLYFSGGAALVISGENHPCRVAGRAIEDQSGMAGAVDLFPKAARGLRGVVAVVELPGIIAAGETVRAEVPAAPTYSPESMV